MVLEAIPWENTYFGNSVQDYAIALGVFILSMIVLRFFKFVLIYQIKTYTSKTKNKLDDLIVDIFDLHWPFYVFLALYAGTRFIVIQTTVDKIIRYIMIFVLVFYVAKTVGAMIDYAVRQMTKKKGIDHPDAAAADLFGKIGKIIVWILVVLFAMANLGYNITTLLAGLGIGGVAIAFALQSILADIFASFSIYFDKPFRVGDFIIVGEDMGNVEKIGIKSTRIRSLQGHQLIVSNKELTDSRVNNYQRMKRRRVAFSFGVTYQTRTSKLKKIPGIVKMVIGKIKDATFDRAHWKEYGDFALIFEAVYYVEGSDFLLYRDVQEKINQGIFESFEKEKINMAYPTQTLYVK